MERILVRVFCIVFLSVSGEICAMSPARVAAMAQQHKEVQRATIVALFVQVRFIELQNRANMSLLDAVLCHVVDDQGGKERYAHEIAAFNNCFSEEKKIRRARNKLYKELAHLDACDSV